MDRGDARIKLVTHGAQCMQQHVRIQATTVGHVKTRHRVRLTPELPQEVIPGKRRLAHVQY